MFFCASLCCDMRRNSSVIVWEGSLCLSLGLYFSLVFLGYFCVLQSLDCSFIPWKLIDSVRSGLWDLWILLCCFIFVFKLKFFTFKLHLCPLACKSTWSWNSTNLKVLYCILGCKCRYQFNSTSFIYLVIKRFFWVDVPIFCIYFNIGLSNYKLRRQKS